MSVHFFAKLNFLSSSFFDVARFMFFFLDFVTNLEIYYINLRLEKSKMYQKISPHSFHFV